MLRRFRRKLRLSRPLRTLDSLTAYALWAESYPASAHNALMRVEQDVMRAFMPALVGKVVLDLASGTGRYGLLATEQQASCVIGCDSSPAMLARNALTLRCCASMLAIPLESESIDVVLCGLAVGHISELDIAFAEISRVLKPGGLAVISDFHPLMYLNGGLRTFIAPDGRIYAVEHHPHLYADYHRAVLNAGLHIEQVAEPRLKPDAPSGNLPVVLVLKLRK